MWRSQVWDVEKPSLGCGVTEFGVWLAKFGVWRAKWGVAQPILGSGVEKFGVWRSQVWGVAKPSLGCGIAKRFKMILLGLNLGLAHGKALL